jgi:hypothetical protein
MNDLERSKNFMKVNLNDLEKIISLLIEKLRESKGNYIEIDNDYYWDIPNEDIYKPYKEPEIFTLGQLSDDLIEIERIIEGKDAVVYDLKRISCVLKALSIENPIAF